MSEILLNGLLLMTILILGLFIICMTVFVTALTIILIQNIVEQIKK